MPYLPDDPDRAGWVESHLGGGVASARGAGVQAFQGGCRSGEQTMYAKHEHDYRRGGWHGTFATAFFTALSWALLQCLL